MSKKGVSAQEKKNRMLQLFYEKGECFQLKELEKIAPKEKGIISNSVKDVLQNLVDDDLVDTDKIGNSTYFWAFPSKALNIRKRKLENYQNQYESSLKQLKLLEKELSNSKDENNQVPQMTIDEINERELELYTFKNRLVLQKTNDPRQVEKLIKNTTAIKDGANRWTDNIFATKTWCKKKFFIEEAVLNKQFQIPEDLDYIE